MRKALIVVSELDVARLLAQHLAYQGFQSKVLLEGQPVFSHAREGPPDLIILNYNFARCLGGRCVPNAQSRSIHQAHTVIQICFYFGPRLNACYNPARNNRIIGSARGSERAPRHRACSEQSGLLDRGHEFARFSQSTQVAKVVNKQYIVRRARIGPGSSARG